MDKTKADTQYQQGEWYDELNEFLTGGEEGQVWTRTETGEWKWQDSPVPVYIDSIIDYLDALGREIAQLKKRVADLEKDENGPQGAKK